MMKNCFASIVSTFSYLRTILGHENMSFVLWCVFLFIFCVRTGKELDASFDLPTRVSAARNKFCVNIQISIFPAKFPVCNVSVLKWGIIYWSQQIIQCGKFMMLQQGKWLGDNWMEYSYFDWLMTMLPCC